MDIALIIVFLLLSAFYAGVETAYTAFDRILLEVWTRRKRVTARFVKFLTDRPERFLGTTLIGNNLVNVAYSTMFAAFATEHGWAPVWTIVLAPCIVLIFGEILPKAIFFGSANLMVRLTAFPLGLSYLLFTPVYVLVRLVSRILAGKEKPVDLTDADHYFANKILPDQKNPATKNAGSIVVLEFFSYFLREVSVFFFFFKQKTAYEMLM